MASHPQTLPIFFDGTLNSKHHSWGLSRVAVVFFYILHLGTIITCWLDLVPTVFKYVQQQSYASQYSLLFLGLSIRLAWFPHKFTVTVLLESESSFTQLYTSGNDGPLQNERAILCGARTDSVQQLNRQNIPIPEYFPQH